MVETLPPVAGGRVLRFGWLASLGCLLLLLTDLAGWCRSGCATPERYSSLFGLPTALVGSLYHATVVLLGLTHLGWGHRRLGRLLLTAYAGGIAASLFFAGVLWFNRSWCGICVACHLQQGLLALMILCTAPRRGIFLAQVLLLVPLFGALVFIGGESPVVTVLAPPAEAASIAGETEDGYRTAETAMCWGQVEAPLQLTVNIDAECPACRDLIPSLGGLRPEIEAGRLALRFLLTCRRGGHGRAFATLAQAAGFLGGEELWQAMCALADWSYVGSDAEVLELLTQGIEPERLRRAWRNCLPAIGECLRAAEAEAQAMAAGVEPALWLRRRGEARVLFRAIGFVGCEELRRALVAAEAENRR